LLPQVKLLQKPELICLAEGNFTAEEAIAAIYLWTCHCLFPAVGYHVRSITRSKKSLGKLLLYLKVASLQ